MTASLSSHHAVLTAVEAADYVGCKDRPQFMREVRAGHWPKALPIKSRPRRWARAALDARLAEITGISPSSGPDNLSLELAEWQPRASLYGSSPRQTS